MRWMVIMPFRFLNLHVYFLFGGLNNWINLRFKVGYDAAGTDSLINSAFSCLSTGEFNDGNTEWIDQSYSRRSLTNNILMFELLPDFLADALILQMINILDHRKEKVCHLTSASMSSSIGSWGSCSHGSHWVHEWEEGSVCWCVFSAVRSLCVFMCVCVFVCVWFSDWLMSIRWYGYCRSAITMATGIHYSWTCCALCFCQSSCQGICSSPKFFKRIEFSFLKKDHRRY